MLISAEDRTSSGAGGQPAGAQDPEFEAGALASRHGISVDQARAIITKCGNDPDAIEAEAKRWKARGDR
ncbi:MAG: hypothetical protein M9955_03285 [Rhizobiaceae bacterium]|nr:hypothetical protein [Rhizobiaceae bacterium]